MKRILYLTFYYEPDLCAGSFRNTPLIKELSKQVSGNAVIDVVTTMPNRYNSFDVNAAKEETQDNITIKRVVIPKHNSGMRDQILSFKSYYSETKRIVKGIKYDLVIASSSRLFTAYLGYSVAKSLKVPLYLDIRDIFYDTLEDVLGKGIVKRLALPIIKKIENRTFEFATHINLISAGFLSYFEKYKKKNLTFFPNGIDDIFIEANKITNKVVNQDIKTVVYAGNLGEGQGLHKIIPQIAKSLEGKMKFLIIGDGGAKSKLEQELINLSVINVELRAPVKRDLLIDIYKNADYLFVHLNNYKAFERVLPSKLFELAAFPQPLIVGVGGFAAEFVQNFIDNVILFKPCDTEGLIEKLNEYNYRLSNRSDFISKFKRDAVNREMATTMLNYLNI